MHEKLLLAATCLATLFGEVEEVNTIEKFEKFVIVNNPYFLERFLDKYSILIAKQVYQSKFEIAKKDSLLTEVLKILYLERNSKCSSN